MQSQLSPSPRSVHERKQSIHPTTQRFGVFALAIFFSLTLSPHVFAQANSPKDATERLVLKENCVLWRFTKFGLKRAVRMAYKGEEFLIQSKGSGTVRVFGAGGDTWISKNCSAAVLDWKKPKTSKMKAVKKIKVDKKHMNCPARWFTLRVQPDKPKKLSLTLQKGKVIRRAGAYCLSPDTQRIMLELEGYSLCLFDLPKTGMYLNAQLETNAKGTAYCISSRTKKKR